MHIFQDLDINLTKRINNLANQNKTLLKSLIIITNTSDGRIYILYAILIPFIIPLHGIEILKIGLPAFAFQVPVYFFIKNLVKRNRPCHDLEVITHISPPDKYSFPSGHCASATLLVLIMNTFNIWILPGLIAWMFLVYFSRVALGLHYISDVFGGVVLGITSFVIGYNVSQFF